MRPDEQRIAIAEWCGWKSSPDMYYIDKIRWRSPDGAYFATCDLPDYLNDLNAIHEAESQLSPLDHQKFCLFLHKQIMGTMDNFDINGTCNLECISRVVKSTAAQRAEALLRTIGKWETN